MAATSPYSQNDYSGFKFRPMELPINDIFKGIMVKNQYWNQKASEIKNQYDTALGLELTLDENKEIRDGYVQKAREEIKKLSSMNLTDPEVQKQSMQLFQPLFKDKGIIYDDTLTKLRKNIIDTAMSYRDKDGGKEYSDENLTDALSKFESFTSSTSRGDVGNIYEMAKNSRYVPYYNVQQEMIMLRDKCGQVSASKMEQRGDYDVTVTKSGTPVDKLSNCLEFLSPQALTQMGISGRVQYGKNYTALGDHLHNIYNNQLKLIEQELAENDGKMKSATVEERDYLDRKNSQLRARKVELSSSIQKLANKDYSDVENNYDSLAGVAYKYNTINGFAASFYKDEETLEYDANAFSLLARKHQYNLIENAQSAALKGKTLKGKDLSEGFAGVDSEFGSAEQKTVGYNYDQLTEMKNSNTSQFNKQMTSLYSDLLVSTNSPILREMKEKGLLDFGTSLDGTINDMNTEIGKFYTFLKGYYDAASAKDTNGKMRNPEAIKLIQPYFNEMQNINEKQNIIAPLLKEADDIAIRDAGELNIGGITFKGKDYNDLVSGKNPNYILYKYDEFISTGMTGGKWETKTGLKTKTGEIIETDLDSKINNSVEKVKRKKDEYLTKDLAVQTRLYNIGDTDEAVALKKRIAGQAGIGFTTDADLNQYIQVVGSPLDGSAYIRLIKPKDVAGEDDEFYEKSFKSIAAWVGNSNILETDKPGVFKITNVKDFDLSQDLYNFDLISQAASIGKKKMMRDRTSSYTLSTRMTVDGQMMEMIMSQSGNIFITDKNTGNTLRTYPESQLNDALIYFNSRVQGRTKENK